MSSQTWGTFYSAYQDGLDAQKEGDDAKALAAFQAASQLRPTPGDRVRTYGLNFLEPYHPYLHLAEAALALGRFDTAAGALRTSQRLGLEPRRQWETLVWRLLPYRRDQGRVLARADRPWGGGALGLEPDRPGAVSGHLRF